jgi:carbonic anhydrase/acetyltransferase-like protein (isoleucine patch superfamily)
LCPSQGVCDFAEYLSRLPKDSQQQATLSPTMPSSSCPNGTANTTGLMDRLSVHGQALHGVWSTLCEIQLYGLYVPNGVFYHLGTSAELQSLLCSPLHTAASHSDVGSDGSGVYVPLSTPNKLTSLCRKYRLERCVSSVLSITHHTGTDGDMSSTSLSGGKIIIDPSEIHFIAIGSSVNITPYQFSSVDGSVQTRDATVAANRSIGTDCVIDHCILHGNVSIGAGSVLSHIGSEIGLDLNVPARILIQQVPLRLRSNVLRSNVRRLSRKRSAAYQLSGDKSRKSAEEVSTTGEMYTTADKSPKCLEELSLSRMGSDMRWSLEDDEFVLVVLGIDDNVKAPAYPDESGKDALHRI